MAAMVLLAWLLLADDHIQTGDSPGEQNAGAVSNAPGPILLEELSVETKARARVAVECNSHEEELTAEEIQRLMDELVAHAVPVLESSADAEHLMIAALLIWRKQPERAAQLLNTASVKDPGNPLVASQHLELCDRFGGHCGQPRVALEDRLISTDRQNGMAWLQVTRSRLSRNNESGALDALREAASAAVFDDYFAQHVLAFERAFAAAAGLSSYETLEDAFGFAAAMLSGAYNISSDCNERSGSSAEWHDLCLRLGERLEHDSRTVMGKMIGMGIQKNAYELSGDTRKLSEVVERTERMREEWLDLIPETDRAMDSRNAGVVREYLDMLVASNEIEAMKFLGEEIRRYEAMSGGARQGACQTP